MRTKLVSNAEMHQLKDRLEEHTTTQESQWLYQHLGFNSSSIHSMLQLIQ